ncbi:uncharacterized protein FIBRA_03301 [Fibroporia radiculosa]|uniref:UBX domain-containing protein n=1 Tax=Fibroporia radiculosa TaxID=599839 RepID=J4HVX1_9APHY|nr:uncharacterized protein FIBRA_03301 [Fibroporia radiculosa]CCM01252.1 predicted protein [Fibroporia radiculosa]
MDVDALSPSQKDALGQLQALMNGGDADVAIGVLDSVNWDVQRAAEMIFDNGVPPPLSRPGSRTNIEHFEVDDSEQGLLIPTSSGREFRPVRTPSSGLTVRPVRALIAVITLPLRLITSILRFLFRILRVPFPQFVPFTWSSLSYRSHGLGNRHDSRLMDPRSVAERWVRALEEETGAVCISRSGARNNLDSSVNDHGVSSGTDAAGPSTLTARMGPNDSTVEDVELKSLPDFFLGSYENFVRTCEKSAKIGCVILVSEEHDDVPEFKRSTLTDPTLLKLVQENDIIVWGGDIRDKDPWSASQKLQATTYPFVAFIALQARRTTGPGTASAPTLTILSRHQGPCIPSTSAPTAAQTLATHLTDHLLPRVTPFLARIKAQAAERERERALRAEQDRAFEESRQRDKERVERRLAEDKRAEDERRLRAEAEEQRRAWHARRMDWRRYERRALVTREPRPGESGRGKTMRVGLRLPDGRRLVRFFGESDSMTALHAYVDSHFIPAELAPDSDPHAPPGGATPGEIGLVEEVQSSGRSETQWWGFQLVLAYPRKELAWEPSRRLGDVDVLKSGGQLVVEMVGDMGSGDGKGKEKAAAAENSDDGYETED